MLFERSLYWNSCAGQLAGHIGFIVLFSIGFFYVGYIISTRAGPVTRTFLIYVLPIFGLIMIAAALLAPEPVIARVAARDGLLLVRSCLGGVEQNRTYPLQNVDFSYRSERRGRRLHHTVILSELGGQTRGNFSIGLHNGKLDSGAVKIGTIDIDDGVKLDELQKLAPQAANAYLDARR